MSIQESKKEKMSENDVHAALSCDDILNEILLWLPEKCVFGLILVSKRWLRVICSSSFRSEYHARWRVNFHLLGFFVCNQLYLCRPKDGMQRASDQSLSLHCSYCQLVRKVMMYAMICYLLVIAKSLVISLTLLMGFYFVAAIHRLILFGTQSAKCYSNFLNLSGSINDYVWHSLFRTISMTLLTIRLFVQTVNASVRLTVSIETFSSETGTWKHFTFTCSSNFALRPWTVATVINGVVYWFATQGNIATKESLAIYDPRVGNRCIALLKLPDGKISQDYDAFVFGESSDGLLQYGQSSKSGMEIWVLDKEQDSSSSTNTSNLQSSCNWNLRYRIGFKSMWKKYPSFCKPKEAEILSFLPENSEYVFIRAGQNILLFHFGSQRMKSILYHGPSSPIQWDFSKVVPYFQPSWPRSSSCHENAKLSSWPSSNHENVTPPAWPSW